MPAVGVVLGIVRRRRVAAVGVVVLLGIAIATGPGLASGNARLVLLEGSVPTALFGAVGLGSPDNRAGRTGERVAAEAAASGDALPPIAS